MKQRNSVGPLIRTVLLFGAALVSSALLPATGTAQVLFDHQARSGAGKLDLTPVLSFSEIEYDGDDSGTAEVERTIFGLTGGYGLSDTVDFYGEIAYIQEAQLENIGDDGDGYLLGAGVRGIFWRQDKLSLRGFGGARFIDEEYGRDIESRIIEIHGGVVGRAQVTPEFGLYAGLDVVPFTDGEIDFRGSESDFDRDDALGLRLGGDYTARGITLSGEFPLISEQGFTFRITFPL